MYRVILMPPSKLVLDIIIWQFTLNLFKLSKILLTSLWLWQWSHARTRTHTHRRTHTHTHTHVTICGQAEIMSFFNTSSTGWRKLNLCIALFPFLLWSSFIKTVFFIIDIPREESTTCCWDDMISCEWEHANVSWRSKNVVRLEEQEGQAGRIDC